MLALDACSWVVREFALALGLVPDPTGSPSTRAARRARRLRAASASPQRRCRPSPRHLIKTRRRQGGTGTLRLGRVPGMTRERRAGPAVMKQGPRPAKPGWSAVISADRGYFDEVIAEGGLDETGISFPGSYPQRSVRLPGTEMRIGRRSAPRGITPEIDLSGPHADIGISHLHAVLIAQQDGTWLLPDQGSSNGTQVNGRQVASGVPVPLRDGDRISLGVWTVLTVRAA